MNKGDSKPRRSTQEAGRLSRSSNRSENCAGFMEFKLTQAVMPVKHLSTEDTETTEKE